MKLKDYFHSEEECKAFLASREVYNADDTKGSIYKPIPFAELMVNPPRLPEWVVEQLFPLRSVGIIGGDGGVGKSWLVLHLALCIASGKPLFGQFPVKQGKVLLIDEEDALVLIHQRMSKLMKGMGLKGDEHIPLSILDNKGIRLDRGDSYDELGKLIVREKPTLVTLDSLIRLHGADENSANAMNDVLRRAKALIAGFDSSIIFTHHARKYSKDSNSASQRLRGSTDIRNFVDTYLFMTGNNTEKTLIHDKSRWSPPVPDFTVKLEDVDSGKATVLSYIGDNVTKSIQKEEAEKHIVSLLTDNGKMNRKQIIAEVKNRASVGMTTIDAALKELYETKIIDSKGGGGVTKEYWLNAE